MNVKLLLLITSMVCFLAPATQDSAPAGKQKGDEPTKKADTPASKEASKDAAAKEKAAPESKPAKPAGKVSKEKVAELLKQLDADSASARDAAEKELVTLGPDVLKHIPSLDARELSAEQKDRIKRIVPVLWERELFESVAGKDLDVPTTPIPLEELLPMLAKQTGNKITDLREQFSQEVTNPKITLSGKNKRFWSVMQEIAEQAQLTVYLTTDDREVGLTARQENASSGLVRSAGSFRFELERMAIEKRFNGDQSTATCALYFQVAVEPRLRPLQFSLQPEDLKIIDDKGQKVELASNGPIEMPVDRESIQFPLVLRSNAPRRSVSKFKSLTATFQVAFPSHVEKFTLPASTEKGSTASLGTTRISLERVTNDEGQWTFPVVIESLAPNPQAESNLQSLLEHTVYLQKADGTIFKQNGGLSTTMQEDNKQGFEFIFVDAPGEPGDYQLVIEVPVGFVRVPVKLELGEIELP